MFVTEPLNPSAEYISHSLLRPHGNMPVRRRQLYFPVQDKISDNGDKMDLRVKAVFRKKTETDDKDSEEMAKNNTVTINFKPKKDAKRSSSNNAKKSK
jgi:hypothetical protein